MAIRQKPGPRSSAKIRRADDHRPTVDRRGSRVVVGSARPAEEDTIRVCGVPAVRALFETAPDSILRMMFDAATAPQVGLVAAHLASRRRPYRVLEGEALERAAGTSMHGGVVAIATARPVDDVDAQTIATWATSAAAHGSPPALLILDGVGNPHNLGAIARTAAFFGLKHLVLSDHPAQSLPSDAAYRVSEGGLFHLSVVRLRGLGRSLGTLRQSYCVVATVAPSGARRIETLRSVRAAGDVRPFAVVLGNEENGLPKSTIAACDAAVTLPGSGAVQSLNVAATAAILIWEATRPRSG